MANGENDRNLAQVYAANKRPIEEGIRKEETVGAVAKGLGLGSLVGLGSFVASNFLGLPAAESAMVAGGVGVVSGTLEGLWVHWAAPAIVVNRYLHEEVTLLNANKLNGFSGSEEVERRRLVSKRASADFHQYEALGAAAGAVAGLLGGISVSGVGHELTARLFELDQIVGVGVGEGALKLVLEGASWLAPALTVFAAGVWIGDSAGVMIGINEAVKKIRKEQGGGQIREYLNRTVVRRQAGGGGTPKRRG